MAVALEEALSKTSTMNAFPSFEEFTNSNVGTSTLQRPTFETETQNTTEQVQRGSSLNLPSFVGVEQKAEAPAVVSETDVEKETTTKKKAKLNWKAKLIISGYVGFVVLILGLILGNYRALNAGRAKTPISSFKSEKIEKVIDITKTYKNI